MFTFRRGISTLDSAPEGKLYSAETAAVSRCYHPRKELTPDQEAVATVKSHLTIFFAFAFVMLPVPTQAAQMTLADLRDICGGTDETSTAACSFYILGVTEGAGLGAGIAKDKGHFCVPEGVSSKKMVLIVEKAMVADLAAFPKDKNMPAVSFVAASLQQAFPCGK